MNRRFLCAFILELLYPIIIGHVGLKSGNPDFVVLMVFCHLQTDLILFLRKYCYYQDKILDQRQFCPANTASQLKTTNQVREEWRAGGLMTFRNLICLLEYFKCQQIQRTTYLWSILANRF